MTGPWSTYQHSFIFSYQASIANANTILLTIFYHKKRLLIRRKADLL